MSKQNVALHTSVAAVDQAEISQIVKSLAEEVIQFLVGTGTQLDFLLDAVYPYLTTLDHDEDAAKYNAEYKRRESELMARVAPMLRKAIVDLFSEASLALTTTGPQLATLTPEVSREHVIKFIDVLSGDSRRSLHSAISDALDSSKIVLIPESYDGDDPLQESTYIRLNRDAVKRITDALKTEGSIEAILAGFRNLFAGSRESVARAAGTQILAGIIDSIKNLGDAQEPMNIALYDLGMVSKSMTQEKRDEIFFGVWRRFIQRLETSEAIKAEIEEAFLASI